jgi:excisionase family DNA binding protein
VLLRTQQAADEEGLMDVLKGLPPTIGVEEAGELLGLCRSSAYRAVQRGEIPTIRLNGRLHVPTARLRTMLGYLDEDTAEMREAG